MRHRISWSILTAVISISIAHSDASMSQTSHLPVLEQRKFSDLAEFQSDNFLEAWATFSRTCKYISSREIELRAGVPANERLREICGKAMLTNPSDSTAARNFIKAHFEPFQIITSESQANGNNAFLTGYYQPLVAGSLQKSTAFTQPIYGRPDDLIALDLAAEYPGLPSGLSAGRKTTTGAIVPFPTRREIDGGAINEKPIIWVRDAIEAFMIHVQGSATIDLGEDKRVRLTYAGRNGHPYTSVGRRLIESGEMSLDKMSLETLKQWVRDNGQEIGQKGRDLLQLNASYVFFSADASTARNEGPIGGAGIPLSPMRSIAIDRNIWSYGLPFWIEAELPLSPKNNEISKFRRLVIAQDTGSAIVGSARVDIYFGLGDQAGIVAGNIRHRGRLFVLLPKAKNEVPEP